MNLGYLSLLQFLLDPLQYFSTTRIGIIPGVYLGRLLTALLLFSCLASGRRLRFALVLSVRTLFLSKPFCFFVWITLIAAIPPLFSAGSPELIFRFSLLEPLTNITYLCCFAILPSFISTPSQRSKITKLLLPFVVIVLFIGYIDYFSSAIGFNLLGRSLFDRISVGIRFHSLFHEPRDYAVASIYILSILFTANISSLSNLRLPGRLFTRTNAVLVLLFLSPFLSKSATFFVGISIFVLISLFVITLKQFSSFPSLSRLSFFISILLFFAVSLYLFVPTEILLGERVYAYYESFAPLLSSLDTKSVIELVLKTPLLQAQSSTFLPIIAFLNSISINSIVPTLLGYGHGFVSNFLVSNVSFDSADIYNSYSGLTRLLCETGILGLASFTYMFFEVALRPLRSPSFVVHDNNKFSRVAYVASVSLLFCMYLAHRRQELFLCMGFIRCFLGPDIFPVNVLPPKQFKPTVPK